jgi:rhodanese-related sulfurtransferase
MQNPDEALPTMDHTTRKPITAGGESLSPVHATHLLAEGGQLIDVRSPADFVRGALPGAVNLPMEAIRWRYRSLKRWRPVILYGNSVAHCRRAAQLLAGEGFSRIYYLNTDRSGQSDA